MEEKYKILIVDDEQSILDMLKLQLEFEGYSVYTAGNAAEALDKLSYSPDIVLLDINMDGMNGLDLCVSIRDFISCPIIFLTARVSEQDKINGLMAGGDDYITKPFSMPILIRKIAAVLRRSMMIPNQEHQTISYKNLTLDLDSYSASVNVESHELTQREFEVLRELLLNQGRVLTRQNLLDRLWKYDFYGDERVVDTHIKNLRKKLGIDFIQTIRGVGYKIDKEK